MAPFRPSEGICDGGEFRRRLPEQHTKLGERINAAGSGLAYYQSSIPFPKTPKGSRNLQTPVRQALTTFKKESILTKRVPFGELFVFLRTNAPSQLTRNAESPNLSAFCVSCLSRKGLRRFRRGPRRSLFRERATRLRKEPSRFLPHPRISVTNSLSLSPAGRKKLTSRFLSGPGFVICNSHRVG